MPETLESDTRLDVFLVAELPNLSRSRIQSLIKEGAILLGGQKVKPKFELKGGESIEVTIPEPTPVEAQPEDIHLEVLYEDEDLIIINKAAGMVVHPAVGNESGTLVNALLYHCPHLQGIGGEQRPGIVHRLDKETSGCLVAAKNQLAHVHLVEQFKNRQTGKLYLAVGEGLPAQKEYRVENRVARDPHNRLRMKEYLSSEVKVGKTALSDLRVVEPRGDSALWMVRIHTGRTHQIRVHLKGVGHAILGDSIYARGSKQPASARMLLHAWRLRFYHPKSGEAMVFETPIPQAFDSWLPEKTILNSVAGELTSDW